MSTIARSIVAPGRALLPSLLALAGAITLIGCGNDDRADESTTPATPTAERAAGTVLEVEPPARLYAADPEDHAGAVAAGDFNGDGALDLALAAAFGDGPGNTDADTGEVYVFLGPIRAGDVRDASAGDQALIIFGSRAGDQTGRSIAAADIDGDGLDDLVIGSPFADGPSGDRIDSGRVDIFAGTQDLGSPASTVSLVSGASSTIYGASAGDFMGISLATGLLNADNLSDLVIGAFWASGPGEARPMAGEIYAVYGAAGMPASRDLSTTPADVTVYGAAAEDRLGEGVASGDINGDGLDDLVLPAPFAASPLGPQDAGRTYVITSPPAATIDMASFTPAATIHGVDDGDQLGHVPVSGDFDGDGRDDILLTAVSADGPSNSVDLAGEAAVILAKDLQAEVDGVAGQLNLLIYGEEQEDRLGRSAAGGDIDGDGDDEVLLGASGADSIDGANAAGRIYVLSLGSLETELRLPGGSSVYYGEEAGDALASEVYGRMPLQAADLDGDGRTEIVVAAPLADGPENARRDCGEALILFITRTPPP